MDKDVVKELVNEDNQLKEKIAYMLPLLYPQLVDQPEVQAEPVERRPLFAPPEPVKMTGAAWIKDKWKGVYMSWQFSAFLFGATILICGLVMILTTVNLNWLLTTMNSQGDELLIRTVDRQIVDYAAQLSNEYSEKFDRSATYLQFCSNLFRENLEQARSLNPIIQTSKHLYWHDEIPIDMKDYAEKFPRTPVSYEFPALYTPHHKLSDAGLKVVNNMGTLNVLIPDLFNPQFMYMSIAFAEDDLYFIYPGFKINEIYFANSRAWFLGAYERNGDIATSEPYRDKFTGDWLVSLSLAIYYPNGDFRAVVGIDYFLKTYYEEINDIRILSNGFACIISRSGLLVSDVDAWGSESFNIRIFDEDETGISVEQFLEIHDASIDLEHQWRFQLPQDEKWYHAVRNYIYDWYGRQLFEVFVAAREDEIVKIMTKQEDEFAGTYIYILWVCVAIAIVTVLYFIVMIFKWMKMLKGYFSMLFDVSYEIILNASKPTLLQEVDINVLKVKEGEQDQLADLKYQFRQSLKRIRQRDNEYPYPAKVWSRPREEFPYQGWMEEAYSLNGMYMKSVPFRDAIRDLHDFDDETK